jgi:sec-independent protein translocase protein TatC
MAIETEEPRTETDMAEEELEGGPVKSFLEHLEDLRWMLIKSGAAAVVGMLVCLLGANYVVAILKRPLEKARIKYPDNVQVINLMVGTNRPYHFQLNPKPAGASIFGTNPVVNLQFEPLPAGTNQAQWFGFRLETNAAAVAESQKLSIDLINLGPAKAFVVATKVAFFGGLALASPFIFYFVSQFVFPALRMKEKKYVYRGLVFGLGLFASGVCFCYYALMPVALAASALFSNWLGFTANQWTAEDYIGFVCKFMLGMGLGFEMPVVILVLVKIGILNYRMLSRGRRYMIVINFTLGAVLTTPEVVTQVLMALPLQLLYEISVWIAWYWERKERKRAQAAGEVSS